MHEHHTPMPTPIGLTADGKPIYPYTPTLAPPPVAACQHTRVPAPPGRPAPEVVKWVTIGAGASIFLLTVAVAAVAVAIGAVAITICVLVLRSLWQEMRKGR
ncbi:SpdD protein [Streptomyces sp. AC536]|uniref:SpdD protein n=1 Tax=Streptomyces buecherae TaxID=2763006 RepID=UPI00164D7E5E|nr:SpdD protein [Streptomyces buecherae]MBC3982750.1 SpdD protein [Streptomyces buecherae]QNJ41318.1 SpdD protein [Streptomyces buecherae]